MFPVLTRRLTGVLAALVLALSLPGLAPQGASAAQKYAAPTRLRTTAVAGTEAGLAWRKVAGASSYRVQYSTSSRMTNPRSVRTDDWTATLTGLRPGRTYYARVRVTSASGKSLGAYSAKVRFRTPAALKRSYFTPTGLAVVPTGANTIETSWNQGSPAAYRVSWADNKAMDGAVTATTTGTRYIITGLAAVTRYWVRVKAVDAASGASRSRYTGTVAGTTLTADSATVRVGSYNVKCANCLGGLSWYERRGAVVQTILGQDLDVIGVQEASQGWLRADAGAGDKINKSQFDDLVKRLGSPYKITNSARNNCVNPDTPTNCVYEYHAASLGTRIIYNSDTLTLLKSGSKKLTRLEGLGNRRFVAWAVFRHKASGKEFFFADTHLESLQGDEFYQLRIQQAQEVLAVVAAKSAGLPSYVVGDFNSSKWAQPDNGPRAAMLAGGLVDPLGNPDHTYAVESATVDHRIHTNVNSFNNYEQTARHTDHVNGSYLDYIFTSPGVEVPEWETVVNVDADYNFVGIIPSDHNLIRATTVLR